MWITEKETFCIVWLDTEGYREDIKGGKSYLELERLGTPSRWNTLRALRVLKWWELGVPHDKVKPVEEYEGVATDETFADARGSRQNARVVRQAGDASGDCHDQTERSHLHF